MFSWDWLYRENKQYKVAYFQVRIATGKLFKIVKNFTFLWINLASGNQ